VPKPILQLAAIAVLGVFAWKVFFPFMLPFFWFIAKVAFVAGLCFLVLWWLRRDESRDREAPPPSPPPSA